MGRTPATVGGAVRRRHDQPGARRGRPVQRHARGRRRLAHGRARRRTGQRTAGTSGHVRRHHRPSGRGRHRRGRRRRRSATPTTRSRLLDAGYAVVLEKPLCRTLAEADDIVEASARHLGRLLYGENLAYSPVVQRLVDAGAPARACHPPRGARAAGRCPTGATFTRDEWGGGALFDLGVHPLAVALLVANAAGAGAPVAVRATLRGGPAHGSDEHAEVFICATPSGLRRGSSRAGSTARTRGVGRADRQRHRRAARRAAARPRSSSTTATRCALPGRPRQRGAGRAVRLPGAAARARRRPGTRVRPR